MTGYEATVYFIPGLGFGAASAAPFAATLDDRFRVIGIDLPGQGRTPDARDGSVSALADAALAAIQAEADGGPWLLAAHSMGGKVAALVAARVLSGQANIFGLAGAVLLAPSPLTPEPLGDDKRATLLAWAEHGALSEVNAQEFIAQNVTVPLAPAAQQEAVAQVRRMSPLSWRRWLETGSLEDISSSIGVIDLPVVVLAGEDDRDLGASAQPQLLGALYPRARFVSLGATGHLLPYERPDRVAAEIVALWESVASRSPRVDPEWGRVIASERTDTEARALLARRAVADDANYPPRALSPAQLATLRALADRLVPQPGVQRIDLAARIDADLAAGHGDGWRPSDLPDDASAYRRGLDAVTALWPEDAVEQDTLIRSIIAGNLTTDLPWGASGFRRWFEDLRSDLARTWTAHPASFARIGYDGFATGGARIEHAGDTGPAGYIHLGAGVRDPWEPTTLGVLVPDRATRPDEDNDNDSVDPVATDQTGPRGKENPV